MRFPIPVFFIAFVIFLAYLSIKRNRQTQNQKEVEESFLERERLANATRKKDISGLNYLPYCADELSFPDSSDKILAEYETTLRELSNQKIINLSQYSNTDLKLMYGPANLNDLTAYDDNYNLLSSTLLSYAQRAADLDLTDTAIAVLEYAMRLKIDSSRIYLLLAKLYQKQQKSEKIKDIVSAVSAMDESFASLVLPKLKELH